MEPHDGAKIGGQSGKKGRRTRSGCVIPPMAAPPDCRSGRGRVGGSVGTALHCGNAGSKSFQVINRWLR